MGLTNPATAVDEEEQRRQAAYFTGGNNTHSPNVDTVPGGSGPTAGPTGQPAPWERDSAPRPDWKEKLAGRAGGAPQASTPGSPEEQRAGSPGAPPPAAPPPSPTNGMTFAQMQESGYARPAPPPAASLGPVGGATGSALRPEIQSQISKLFGTPTAYDNAAMMQEFAQGAEGIDDQFTVDQRTLDDTMARRGIFDSTIAGDKTRDLNVAKRSAKTGLLQDLATKRATAYDSGIRSALSAAMGQDAQTAQEQIANAGLAGSAQDRALQAELGRGSLGIQRENLDLSRMSQALQRELGLGNLDVSRGNLALNQRGQSFSEGIQSRQLTNAEKAQAHAEGLSDAEFAQRKQSQEFDQKMRTMQLTNEEKAQAWRQGMTEQEFKQRKLENEQQYGLNQNSQYMQFLNLLMQQLFPGGGSGSGSGGGGATGGSGSGSGGGSGSPYPWEQA